MSLDRDTVLASLRPADVAQHYGIAGPWRGRWMRSARCAAADHSTDAFGLAQNGMWHCWACDQGGDLLNLIAIGEKLDIRHDFGKILEIAAAIAGVEDDESFGGSERPAPKPRPALTPVAPLAERVAIAMRRAAWAWDRLQRWDDIGHTVPWGTPGRHSVADQYLAQSRGLHPRVIRSREDLRETPLRVTMEEMAKSAELKSLTYLFATPGVALPVRHVATGALVDIRIRRFEPREGQPKIIGMLGGVTTGGAEHGRPRQLVGCYGRPHEIDSDLVVVVEGALDYLTALEIWPEANVLGAVDAGSFGLVAGLAATHLAAAGEGRLLIVEQNDGERINKTTGKMEAGAADRAVNEDPNAATKVAIRLLGPKRVGWLFCENDGGAPIKDLNDLFRARGAEICGRLHQWYEAAP